MLQVAGWSPFIKLANGGRIPLNTAMKKARWRDRDNIRATGSRRTRQMVARRGRPIGCRTSYEFADRGIDEKPESNLAAALPTKLRLGRDRTMKLEHPRPGFLL